jgi:hypothetical protein
MATSLSSAQILPQPDVAIVDPKTGVFTQDGYKFFNNLLSLIPQAPPTASVQTGIEAVGATQATATPLGNQWNEIDSATAANAGVLLSALQVGQTQVVANVSGVSINVYPQPGSQINALGINQPFALANGLRATFEFFKATQIRT